MGGENEGKKKERTENASSIGTFLGCCILLLLHLFSSSCTTAADRSLPWPLGDDVNAAASQQAGSLVDLATLARVVEEHFADERLHARAFIVVKNGQIIYEVSRKFATKAAVENP